MADFDKLEKRRPDWTEPKPVWDPECQCLKIAFQKKSPKNPKKRLKEILLKNKYIFN